MARRLARNATAWVLLAAVAGALLTANPALAADTGGASFAETAQSFIGGIIASTIINLFVQRRWQRAETKADAGATAITKMETEIRELKAGLSTVQSELVNTLKERDTARDLLNQQMQKNADDNILAQVHIDKLQTELVDERAVSARLEEQLRAYDQRFRDQELKMARIEGRLDQQAIQDQLSSTMQTVAKLLNDVAEKLVGTAAQPVEGAT